MIAAVRDDPFVPSVWGANRSGMQADVELAGWRRWAVEKSWRAFARISTWEARWLAFLGLHKQLANRWMEPAGHVTVIISATSWQNFFYLRAHRQAQPEFQALAVAMKSAYEQSTPQRLDAGEWHMPLIHDEDWDLAGRLVDSKTREELDTEVTIMQPITRFDWINHFLRKVSAGRCGRVSYLNHLGKRSLADDIKLYDRLLAGMRTGEPIHSSPLEHVAKALAAPDRIGNFTGFQQLRKMIVGESGPSEPVW